MHSSFEIQTQVYNYVDALPKVGAREIKAGQTFVIVTMGNIRYFGVKPDRAWYRDEGDLEEMFTHVFVANPSKSMLIGYVQGSDPKIQFRKLFSTAEKDRCVFALASKKDVEFVREKFDEMDRADEWHKGFLKRSRDIHVVWNVANDPSTNPRTPSETHEGFVIEVYDGLGRMKNRSRMICTEGDPINAGNEIENMVKGYAAAYFCHDDVAKGSKFQIVYAPEID